MTQKDLQDELVVNWDQYITIFRTNHIRLKEEEEDELIWPKNPMGESYSLKFLFIRVYAREKINIILCGGGN